MKHAIRMSLILGVMILAIFFIFEATPSMAQFWSPYPFFALYPPVFCPYNLFLPPSPSIVPYVNPVLTPSIASLPILGRAANATIIIILNGTANTVTTTSAPLGTVNLTAGTVVPLSLFLAL